MSGQKRPADADPSEEPASKRQVRFTEPAADPDAEETDDEDDEDEEAAAEEDDMLDKQTAWHTQMMNLLTAEQQSRFEAFRRSSLNKRNMKRLQQTAVGQQVHTNLVIAMCGIAKVFVGELIETARIIAADQGDDGPLRRSHLEAAYQALDRGGRVPHRRLVKRLLR